jgi:hypothetical protein
METKEELISKYVKSVKEKEMLIEKLNLTVLSEEEIHKLLLLNCEMNDLVGKMVEVGLIEVEIAEE